MRRSLVGLRILWWSQIVVAVRALLFTVPVILNNYLSEDFSLSGYEVRLMAVLTGSSLIFLVVGVVSIAGFRFWRTIHFLAVPFTVALTAGVWRMFGPSAGPVDWLYLCPIFFSVAVAGLAAVLDGPRAAAPEAAP